MPTNSTQPRIPNAAELEPLLNGDLNDLTAEILPDLPNSFAGEVGAAVYEMAQSGELSNAEETDFFAAIDTEIAASDKTWLDRLTEGDWGYFAFSAVEAIQGTWMGNVLDFFLPDFLDLQAQKERVLQLTQNPHNILINLRERVERASAIPGMETAAFGLPVSDIETLTNHLEEHTALLESFPYESDAQAQADWWAEAFTDAGLTTPSAVVLSVLSGEAEWTLFLGDANQRILQQVSATTPEMPAAEVSTEMTEVNGVMMSPEYGEMVLLEDTEFVAAVHNTGSEIRQFIENNSGLMSLATTTLLLEGSGGVASLGSLSGIASLPIQHPAVSGAAFLSLMDAEEQTSGAYYPRDREAFIAFMRAKAEASAQPFAENIAFLSDEDLSQLYGWVNGLEVPSFSGLSESIRTYLNPTPENQWREHQIRAFRQSIPNYLRYPLRDNVAIRAKLSEIEALYGRFDAEADISFDSELVQTKIEELNSLLAAHDYRLIEDGNYLYIERPDPNEDTGETIMVRYNVALNPALDIEQQWQIAPHFFAEDSALETLRRGISAATLDHFTEAMRVVEAGEGVFAYVAGAWSFVSGTAVEIVPDELVSYMLGSGEYDGVEWSSQQFAYAYGETVAPLAVIGAARGLRRGVFGMLRGAFRGTVSPISAVFSVGRSAGRVLWNPDLFNARTQAWARGLYHGGVGNYQHMRGNTALSVGHERLANLESLRAVLANYQYGGVRVRLQPNYARSLRSEANRIISDVDLGVSLEQVSAETVATRLDEVDALIEERRGTSLVRRLRERFTGAQSGPDRVRAIEAGDALIENIEQQKASRVRCFIEALNSGDSRMIAYAQEQLTRQVQHGQQVISHIIPLRRQAFATLSESAQVRVGSVQSLLERLRGRVELPHLSPRGRLGLAAGVAALVGGLLLERVLAGDEASDFTSVEASTLPDPEAPTLSLSEAQAVLTPLETTFTTRFNNLELTQGSSVNNGDSRLTPAGVDALVENHELVINDVREALTEPANQAALRTILEESEDQRLEIGTVALTLEDGSVMLNSTSPRRFKETYWEMVDQSSPYNIQRAAANLTGSEIAGSAVDFGTYLVPFVGPYRDLQNSIRDAFRGNWHSSAGNAFFGLTGAVVDTLAWGGSLVTFGGSAVLGTGAKVGLSSLRTTRRVMRARVLDAGLFSISMNSAVHEIFMGSHNRHERLF